MRNPLGTVAGKVGKGLAAGAVGTAAMTLSSSLEAKLRNRKPSTAPADAAAKVLGVEPVGEPEKERFSNIVHWAYGTAWGGARGLLAAFGFRGRLGTLLHLGTVWGTEQRVLPELGVAAPASEQDVEELAIDLWHHVVYAVVTGTAYRVLDSR